MLLRSSKCASRRLLGDLGRLFADGADSGRWLTSTNLNGPVSWNAKYSEASTRRSREVTESIRVSPCSLMMLAGSGRDRTSRSKTERLLRVGTWVPLDRARAIAVQYHVEELLGPIFNFRPSTESPPLAPKHITAASTKPKTKGGRAPVAKRAPNKQSTSLDGCAAP
jgi:hypothetical protein